MKTTSLIKKIALFSCTSLLLFACSNNNQPAVPKDTTPIVEEIIPTGDTATVILQAGDDMKFDLSEIRVPLGQIVNLTLKHTGEMPKTAMGHNFVLLNDGVDVIDFGNATAQSMAPDFNIPTELLKDVFIHTDMIGGGESTTIEFLTPKKGEYTYLCSFPGHYGMMQGKFIVE